MNKNLQIHKRIPTKYTFVNSCLIGFGFIFFGILNSVSAQTTQVLFGQNRVQYHNFDWLYYNSDNFTIYYYPGGQEIGRFVWSTAEKKLQELNKQMDFHFRSQVDILVYNDINDLAQTNIGLGRARRLQYWWNNCF